jgi:type III restriction enzyme
MSDKKYLYEIQPEKAYRLRISFPDIPSYISDNIRFPLFDWQKEALENFLTFQQIKEYEEDINSTHLLFNMATGTGKTLLMATLILYYYEKGYSNFLFFVNQNNIVGKTEDNLTDPEHTKYLFKNPIVINDKTINVKKVDSFSNETDDIEIIFTSIHKLHNSVYQVKENSIFLEDLQSRDIVMLADEAHHLNSDTKEGADIQTNLDLIGELAGNASVTDIEKSWEHTVTNLILKKGDISSTEINRNVLLEFTATVPTHKNVVEKYLDKTIYRFELKDFLKAGYTKEINLISSAFDSDSKKQRILQALIFNWFRYEMGIKYGLPNFKPVILFRSKFVDEEKEENVYKDYSFFREIIDNLSPSDFDFIKNIKIDEAKEIYQKGQSRIIDIKNHINQKKINFGTIIIYLKDTFKHTNCIITHSKDKSASGRRSEDKTTTDQDKKLNSLEDKSNNITAIFTCKRLTEGWDVLNLFDIVRMYEGRDEGKTTTGTRKAGQSTVSEVQLIGRGVRYYPFSYEDKIRNKRKFDKALDHELRVLEEFYFHSDKDERYINELKNELKRQDLWNDDKKVLKLFDIKPEYKDNPKSFYHTISLYKNNQEPNPNRRKRTLKELEKEWDFKEAVRTNYINETRVHLEKDEDDETRYNNTLKDGRILTVKLSTIERHIVFKAINTQAKKEQSILRFNNLKEELELSSIDELFDYLNELPLKIAAPASCTSFDSITPKEQVRILNKYFEKVAAELKRISNPNIGTEFEPIPFRTYFEEPKTISVLEDPANTEIENLLKQKDWYVLNGFYGTSEEQGLITFLKETMENFKDKYAEVYLLRNEEVYKIYDFEKGRGFMPDFLLFLKSKGKALYYQIFIEPKGSQFKNEETNSFLEGKEGWKEKFLSDITNRYAKKSVLKFENKEYFLVGLPLYNTKSSLNFKKAIKEELGVDV